MKTHWLGHGRLKVPMRLLFESLDIRREVRIGEAHSGLIGIQT